MANLNYQLAIEWHKFKPGTSFFIPCIDRTRVQRFVLREAQRLKINIIVKQVIENNIYGLRVWRCEPTIDPHSPSPAGEV